MTVWYKDAANHDDIILSTRIRLARNLSAFPFNGKMNADEEQKVNEQIRRAVLDSGATIASSFHYEGMDAITDTRRLALIEENLMSPQMQYHMKHKGLLLGMDDTVSIMINEEDHLRIQCILGGYHLDEAYESARRVDQILSEQVQYAKNDAYGFLTKCPTNTGTGMRASVMLHLPALSMTDNVERMMNTVGKLGFTVRGMYGEGSKAIGDLYQVSNQITLGVTEQEIITKLKNVVAAVVKREKEIRAMLQQNHADELTDKILRARGTLQFAHMLSSNELTQLLSLVRMGVGLGIVTDVPLSTLTTLLIETKPANLILGQKGEDTSTAHRDILRAQQVKKSFQ